MHYDREKIQVCQDKMAQISLNQNKFLTKFEGFEYKYECHSLIESAVFFVTELQTFFVLVCPSASCAHKDFTLHDTCVTKRSGCSCVKSSKGLK